MASYYNDYSQQKKENGNQSPIYSEPMRLPAHLIPQNMLQDRFAPESPNDTHQMDYDTQEYHDASSNVPTNNINPTPLPNRNHRPAAPSTPTHQYAHAHPGFNPGYAKSSSQVSDQAYPRLQKAQDAPPHGKTQGHHYSQHHGEIPSKLQNQSQPHGQARSYLQQHGAPQGQAQGTPQGRNHISSQGQRQGQPQNIPQPIPQGYTQGYQQGYSTQGTSHHPELNNSIPENRRVDTRQGSRQGSYGLTSPAEEHYNGTSFPEYSNIKASEMTKSRSQENNLQYKARNTSASSLSHDNNGWQRSSNGSSQDVSSLPYSTSETMHEEEPAPLHARRLARKAPPGGLPPIQTNNLYSDTRRIVSSPSVPSPSTGPNNYMPLGTQKYPGMSPNDVRAKPLSSAPKYQQSRSYSEANSGMGPGGQRTVSNTNGNNSAGSHTFSLSSKSRSFSSLGKLSSLSTKKFNSSTSLQNSKLDRHPSVSTIGSQNQTLMNLPKKQIVYPALLSSVAKAFRETIILTINTKDGLEYHDTFTGKMAVDVISRIIRTNDRNLALLLGRSLDAQKFFRDVTFNHRLRDSVHEVYAFNHVYSDVDFFSEEKENGSSGNNSKHGSLTESNPLGQLLDSSFSSSMATQIQTENSSASLNNMYGSAQGKPINASASTGMNGVFTILTDCYSPTCSRNRLCYSIACPRRLEQQARLNLKPEGGLKRAVSKLTLHDKEEIKILWHETVPQSVLDKLDKKEKERQELIYEFIYTERDYVKDLEFMTDFYIIPLRNPSNNIIPEREREAFIRTVFGGINDLLRLAKSFSDSLTRRQQQQKPVIETFGDVLLEYINRFEPFIRYSGNKVFGSFEHERQQQVNLKYARFLDAIERKPESRRQDLSAFLIKGIQRPARYQLLINGIIKNTKDTSPDYKNLLKAKEEIEDILVKMNIQTGESTDRHKVMVLHRLLGKQTLEGRFNFKLSYNHKIVYQVTLNRKRDNEKIDLYLFEHALLLVKHKIQNKKEQFKVFEKPVYLPLLFVNGGYEVPTFRSILNHRKDGSLISDVTLKNRVDSSNYINNSSSKFQLNILGLGHNQVHATLYADDVNIQNQILQQIRSQQKRLLDKHDIFSLSKYETRRFHGNNRINCAVPCYGGKKLLSGTDSGVWISTVRTISASSNEKICSDPTLIISKPNVSQIEVLVEYSKLLVLSDKSLYEFDLACTDSLDHAKNTRSAKLIISHVAFFKTGVCDGRLLVCAAKTGSTHSISVFEPSNPFDKNKNKNRKYDIREISFNSDPVSISFFKTKICVGCTKGFEILSLEEGKKEPILDEADPSLDFATQRETVTPLAIHRLGKNFLLNYSEFSFLINGNGWRTNHDWDVFWEGNPQNIALFYPYLLSFEPNFIEIRDLESTHLIRALVGENIRFLHSNEHEALYACEENGYDILVSIDFLNLKPKATNK